MKRNQKGFTLVELLVVVLILGILVSIALPSYLSSVKRARGGTATANARMIATSVQTAYIKAGGTDYSGFTAANIDLNADILADHGGALPINPCNGEVTAALGYDVVPTATKWTIKAKAGSNCSAGDLGLIQLGN
jgi:prepilin-type N-terminal cleavage/methylation domain-containing protein